jgi:hypothetical protein
MSRVVASVRPFDVPEEYYEVSEGFTSESTDISEFANRLAAITKPKDIPKNRLKSRSKRSGSSVDSQLSASLDNFGLSTTYDTDASTVSTEATSSQASKRLEKLRKEKHTQSSGTPPETKKSQRTHISRSESSDSLKRVTFQSLNVNSKIVPDSPEFTELSKSGKKNESTEKPKPKRTPSSDGNKSVGKKSSIKDVVKKIKKIASDTTETKKDDVSETSSLEELKKAHKRKKKKVAKKEATYTTPTSKESIKLQTKDMKKIKPKYYENIESGTFIKHINSYGKLSLGGYIWVRGLDETTNVIKNYWIVGMSPQSQGGKNYKIFWNNVKAVYIKPNTERDKLIEVVSKQHKALNDIASFLSKRHGKEFQMSVISETESTEKNKSISESDSTRKST